MAEDPTPPIPFDRQAVVDRLGEMMLGVLQREAETNGTDSAAMSADGAVLGSFLFMMRFPNGLEEIVRICEQYRNQAVRLLEAREAADAPRVLQ